MSGYDRYGHRTLHPCAHGHDWDNGAGSQWARCTRCQEMTKLPPNVPAPAPAGPPVPPVPAGPPPVPRGRDLPGYTVEDLGMLRMAGRWGLLRPQSGRRLALCGEFSLPAGDLEELVRCAGGRPQGGDLWQLMRDGLVDVLVAGRDADEDLVGFALANSVPVWGEEELVLELVPSYDSLTAQPGQAPF